MWSTSDENTILNSKMNIYNNKENSDVSHEVYSNKKEDSITQQCKTTKCNNIISFLFQPKKIGNEDNNIKTKYRSHSCAPSFHYKMVINSSIHREAVEEEKELQQPHKGKDSNKTLFSLKFKPHDSCPFSDLTHKHLSSLLSYYASTKEYLLREMYMSLSPFPEQDYIGYHFIEKEKNNIKNKYEPLKVNSTYCYHHHHKPNKPSAFYAYNNNNNAYSNINMQQKVNSSPLLYMRMAQLSYAKYIQSYYKKMNEYLSANNNTGNTNMNSTTSAKSSTQYPFYSKQSGNIDNQSNNNSDASTIEDSKHRNDSPSITMFGKNGWVCEQCHNFNFESRNTCNRCGLCLYYNPPIFSKKCFQQRDRKDKVHKKLNERKGDWICTKCKNLNFAFRTECNRCQIAKTEVAMK